MGEGDEAAGGRPTPEADTRVRIGLAAAIVVGAAARLALALFRPLWADEIFTLALARRPLAELLPALRVDSGPPLHYLVAHLVLLPFPAAGAHDAVVRLLSVAASLLHVPLLLSIGRRCRAPRAGAVGAALFLLFPLAASSAAEGRGYALASLLALAAFERLLALEEVPRPGTALLAGVLGGAAFLTHYLALLPVAGALLSRLAATRARRRVLLAGSTAAAVAAAWIPVALAQPRASMAWAEAQPLGERALQFGANLGLGLSVPPGTARLLGPLAVALLLFALATRRRAARVPTAAPLGVGLLLLVPLLAWSRSALLPDRTAVLLLPFVALVLSEARAAVAAVAATAGAVVLAATLPAALRPTPGSELAATLLPEARAGARFVAAGLWGPELDYRLARAGLPGRVTPFPSDVARHPGWYDESAPDAARLGAEARAAVRGAAGRTFFVLSGASRAGRALAAELAAAGGRRVADAGVFAVWLRDAGPSRERGTPLPP